MFVKVGENEPIESALKRFKRQCERDGIISDYKKHLYYEKPSKKRRLKRLNAVRRLNNKRS
ncbi:MAG: 30S ribosomal protein S21 [Atribacterota bacterium]